MANRVTICDATNLGSDRPVFVLDILTETITVQELIRRRVYQEVKDYNAQQSELFQGLVQPTGAEQTLNGYRMKKARTIDWEMQYERAIAAFNSNGFILLINDEQAESLDQEIELKPETSATFLKLTPLVGG